MKRVATITVDEGHRADNKPFFSAHLTHEGEAEPMFSAQGDDILEAISELSYKIAKFHADKVLNDGLV